MTEENYFYKHTMAERVNGILKDGFCLDKTFTNEAHARRATKNTLNLHHEVRLHLSLDYKTSNMLYVLVR